MDQFMVDVTDIPEAEELDEVTLIGRDGEDCITLEELGDISGRSTLLVSLSARTAVAAPICSSIAWLLV